MSTSVASVASHFPDAENGFTTTLASTIASGTTTIPLNSVAGYTNGQPAVMVVDPTDTTKKQTFTGIIDTGGVQLTSVVWTAGTNQTHTAGATVVDYATATHIAMISKGLQVEHKQAGTHSAVTADSVTVATGKITTSTVGKLEDRSIALDTYRSGFVFDYVVSGGVWSGDAYASTRNGSMTAIAVMINGQLLNSTNSPALGAVAAHLFTASKDTYIDVLNTAGVGTIVYTETTNNAASPALAANSLRIGIIITGATNIAAATSVNQGQETMVLPIASSIPYAVTDLLGNLICPRDPNRKLLGYRQITGSVTATTIAQATGLTCPVIVPTNRKVKVTAIGSTSNSGTNTNLITLWDGVVNSGTQLNQTGNYTASGTGQESVIVEAITTPASASKTYNVGLSAAAGTVTLNAGATNPAFIKVELV